MEWGQPRCGCGAGEIHWGRGPLVVRLQRLLVLSRWLSQRGWRGDVVGVGRLVPGERLLSQGTLVQKLSNSAELVVQSCNLLGLVVQLLGQDLVPVAKGGVFLGLAVQLLGHGVELLRAGCLSHAKPKQEKAGKKRRRKSDKEAAAMRRVLSGAGRGSVAAAVRSLGQAGRKEDSVRYWYCSTVRHKSYSTVQYSVLYCCNVVSAGCRSGGGCLILPQIQEGGKLFFKDPMIKTYLASDPPPET